MLLVTLMTPAAPWSCLAACASSSLPLHDAMPASVWPCHLRVQALRSEHSRMTLGQPLKVRDSHTSMMVPHTRLLCLRCFVEIILCLLH
jgi:hypothetical protein